MSAFICSPEHFAALACYAAAPGRDATIHAFRKSQCFETAQYIAQELARQNIASVAARYPQDADGQRPGPGMLDAEIISEAARIAEKMMFDSLRLSPVQVMKMCDCYEYQSCENEGWEQTPAIHQVRRIRAAAIRLLPGYEDAKWEYRNAKYLEAV